MIAAYYPVGPISHHGDSAEVVRKTGCHRAFSPVNEALDEFPVEPPRKRGGHPVIRVAATDPVPAEFCPVIEYPGHSTGGFLEAPGYLLSRDGVGWTDTIELGPNELILGGSVSRGLKTIPDLTECYSLRTRGGAYQDVYPTEMQPWSFYAGAVDGSAFTFGRLRGGMVRLSPQCVGAGPHMMRYPERHIDLQHPDWWMLRVGWGASRGQVSVVVLRETLLRAHLTTARREVFLEDTAARMADADLVTVEDLICISA